MNPYIVGPIRPHVAQYPGLTVVSDASCGPPRVPPDTNIQLPKETRERYRHNATVPLTCAVGYQGIGRAVATCDNGTWIYSAFRCKSEDRRALTWAPHSILSDVFLGLPSSGTQTTAVDRTKSDMAAFSQTVLTHDLSSCY